MSQGLGRAREQWKGVADASDRVREMASRTGNRPAGVRRVGTVAGCGDRSHSYHVRSELPSGSRCDGGPHWRVRSLSLGLASRLADDCIREHRRRAPRGSSADIPRAAAGRGLSGMSWSRVCWVRAYRARLAAKLDLRWCRLHQHVDRFPHLRPRAPEVQHADARPEDRGGETPARGQHEHDDRRSDGAEATFAPSPAIATASTGPLSISGGSPIRSHASQKR